MFGVTFVNEQLGMSLLDKSAIFSSNGTKNFFLSCGFSRAPCFVLNVKRTRAFDSSVVRCRKISSLLKEGSDVLQKELEFKPSFDEYLKAMESVSSGRDRKRGFGASKDERADDSSKKSVLRESFSDKEKTEYMEDKGDKKAVKVRKDVVQGMDKERKYKVNEKETRSLETEKIKVKVKMKGEKAADQKWNLVRGSKSQYAPESCATQIERTTSGSRFKDDQKPKDQKRFSRATEGHGRSGYKRVDGVESKQRLYDLPRKTIQQEGVVEDGDKSEDEGLGLDRAAFKNFDGFGDIVDKPRVSRKEMEERIEKLAKALNGADIDIPEWMFSKMMRSAKIKFSDYTILRIIQILGKLGNWRRVLQVIDWLQLRERYKSHKLRFVYTAALDVLRKARRPVEALNVFNTMQQQMSSYPDLVAYRSITVTLGQAGHMKELFDVIDVMRSPPKKKFKVSAIINWDPRLEPDIVVYHAVLNACVKRKQWEGAFWVLQQLKQQNQQPSPTTYGLVMEVMYSCGKYNLVHEFFRKVQKLGSPNALTYKVLVNTLWKEGKIDEAVLVVKEMESRGIVGSAGLYYDLARCLCSVGRCQEALMQIEKICKVANKPLVVTYTGLIQACLNSGDIQNGRFIFQEMEKYCSPNLVTCNIMLKAFLEKGMFEDAKELFNKMLENNNHISNQSDYKVRVVPDVYTFNAMLDGCLAEKRWDELEHTYKTMLLHGYHFNAKRHLQMILDASRAGKFVLLEMTWDHLCRADRLPPPQLVKERFIMMLQKNDSSAFLSSIINNATGDSHTFSKVVWLKLFRFNAQRFQRETITRLMNEAKLYMSTSDSVNLHLQNLVMSCEEFLRIKAVELKPR